jgi:hypothetical protein
VPWYAFNGLTGFMTLMRQAADFTHDCERDRWGHSKHEGFEVYSHTASHPWDTQHNLVTWTEAGPAERDLARARAELAQSRMTLLARSAGYTAMLTAEDGLKDGKYRVCQTQAPPTLGHRPWVPAQAEAGRQPR